MTPKTPGVYIEEISSFPPSVAPVETAIPAFIGYTESALDNEGNVVSVFPFVKRISSLLEFEKHFGRAKAQAMEVVVINNEPARISLPDPLSKYRMYYALQMFYSNGGGPCYICSVGQYGSPTESVDPTLLTGGLAAIAKKDEPTLLIFPDLANIDGADEATRKTNYHNVLKAALEQCNLLGDRFLLCDLYTGDSVDTAVTDEFRTGIGSNYLKYGAAYHPALRTNLSLFYTNDVITFDASDPSNINADMDTLNLGDIEGRQEAMKQKELAERSQAVVNATGDLPVALAEGLKVVTAAVAAALAIQNTPNKTLPDADTALTNAQAALSAIQSMDNTNTVAEVQAQVTNAVTEINNAIAASSINDATMNNILLIYSSTFQSQLRQLLAQQLLTIGPSSAVAGVYAMVDRTRGVWKAPANVSLSHVIEPAVKITNADQDLLNVHPTGKSINAIRAFTGKGIMIWGARTLAGNDNEWRYVPVRRFFNMVEESVKKATEPFVFEPNDANTWVKVRSMIENFLTLQWRAGALAGAKPEEAFFVKVGLGETMTADDIVNGRMNVEIGMAAVRPAEFIILKFSHKMQQS